MNFEEAPHESVNTLRSEYRDYNIIGARQDLEDRIISAAMSEVTYPHPSAQSLAVLPGMAATSTYSGNPASAQSLSALPATTTSTSPQIPHGSENWREQSSCRKSDPDRLFTQGAARRQAKLMRNPCPVRVKCLAEALDRRIEFGIWDGMTECKR